MFCSSPVRRVVHHALRPSCCSSPSCSPLRRSTLRSSSILIIHDFDFIMVSVFCALLLHAIGFVLHSLFCTLSAPLGKNRPVSPSSSTPWYLCPFVLFVALGLLTHPVPPRDELYQGVISGFRECYLHVHACHVEVSSSRSFLRGTLA